MLLTLERRQMVTSGAWIVNGERGRRIPSADIKGKSTLCGMAYFIGGFVQEIDIHPTGSHSPSHQSRPKVKTK